MKKQRQAMRLKRRSGATIVEFALILPVLLAILIGIMEFGWLVKNHLLLANGTREGARSASIGKTTSEIQTRIINSVNPLSMVSPNGSIVMTQSADNGTTFLAWPPDVNGKNGVTQGKLIKITTTTRHSSLTGFFPFLRNRDLTVYVTMRREA